MNGPQPGGETHGQRQSQPKVTAVGTEEKEIVVRKSFQQQGRMKGVFPSEMDAELGLGCVDREQG